MTQTHIVLAALMVSFLHAKQCAAQEQLVECILNSVNLPCLKAAINEHEVTMIVDSGASHNVICSNTAHNLNLERSNDFKDWPEIETLADRRIKVAGCTNDEDEPVVVANLSKLSESCKSKIDGVLGLPFLKNKTLVFRGSKVLLGHTRLRQDQSDECRPSETDNFGRVYLSLSDVILDIQEPHSVLIDTGMNQPMSIEEHIFNNLSSAGRIKRLGHLSNRIRFDCDSVGVEPAQSGLLHQNDEAIYREGCLIHTSTKNKVGVPWLMRQQARIDFASRKVFIPICQEAKLVELSKEPSAIRR